MDGSGTVSVVPWTPEWHERFAAERDRLVDLLAPWLAGGVEHIGSTAVPGLAAKPVVDMLAGVRDLGDASAAVGPLAAAGWTHAPHRPDALWFFRPSGGLRERTHHLHLTQPGSPLWRERLTFRDALRADAGLREEYAARKRTLAAAHPDDVAAYAAGKRGFVVRVLAARGVDLPPR